MNQLRIRQSEICLFLHFANRRLEEILARLDGACDELVAIRILPRDQRPGTKFVPEHHLVAFRIVSENGHGVAALHQLPGDPLSAARVALHIEVVAVDLQESLVQGRLAGDARRQLFPRHEISSLKL